MCKCHYIFWLTSSFVIQSPNLTGGGSGSSVCKYRGDHEAKVYNACVADVLSDIKAQATTKAPRDDSPRLPSAIGQLPTGVRIAGQEASTPPTTDEYGFKVPPMMPEYNPEPVIAVGGGQQPPELAAKDEEIEPASTNDVVVKPRIMSDSDGSAPPPVGQHSFSWSPINVNRNSDFGFNAPPLSNGDVAPPLMPKDTRLDNKNEESPPPPLVVVDNHSNRDDQPYPVPEMGSMDSPPLPAALLRMLNDGVLPVNSKKESVAPPTPDMRTPAFPKGFPRP